MDGAFPSQKGQDFDSIPGGYDGGGRGRGRSGFRGTAENAKTKMCNRWIQGDCRFGDRCNFAHGEHELRSMGDTQDRGYGSPRGRGYGGRGGAPGRGYGGRGYGGYPPMGGYQGGYGMEQAPPMGYDQRPAGGNPEDVWAAQGCPVPGPNGWYMYRTKDTGEAYFHNHRTNVTTWERPVEWPMGM